MASLLRRIFTMLIAPLRSQREAITLDLGEPCLEVNAAGAFEERLVVGNGSATPLGVVMETSNQWMLRKLVGHQLVTTTGANSAYVATYTSALQTYNMSADYVAGLQIFVKAHAPNTGPATFAIGTNNVKPIVSLSGAALTGGEIVANGIMQLLFDGVSWRLISSGGSGGSTGSTIYSGSTAARPTSCADGTFYWNTDTKVLEVWDAGLSAWVDFYPSITSSIAYTIPGDFPNIPACLTALSYRRIAGGATVTINLKAGDFNVTTPIQFSHPDGASIKMMGAAPITLSLTGFVSASGATPNYSVVLQLMSVAAVNAGDYVLIQNTTGTGSFGMVNGLWKVAAVNAGLNQITILHTALSATFPTLTLTGGKISVIPSRIKVSAGVSALSFTTSFAALDNVAIIDEARSPSNTGVTVTGSGVTVTLGGSVGIFGFGQGIVGQGTSRTVSAATICAASLAGARITNKSSLTTTLTSGSYGTVTNSVVGLTLLADATAFDIPYAFGCTTGIAINASVITCSRTIDVEDCATGMIVTAGTVNALSGAALSNASTTAISAQIGSRINLPNASFSGNTQDLLANNGAFILVSNAVGLTNTVPPVNTVGNSNSYISTVA